MAWELLEGLTCNFTNSHRDPARSHWGLEPVARLVKSFNLARILWVDGETFVTTCHLLHLNGLCFMSDEFHQNHEVKIEYGWSWNPSPVLQVVSLPWFHFQVVQLIKTRCFRFFAINKPITAMDVFCECEDSKIPCSKTHWKIHPFVESIKSDVRSRKLFQDFPWAEGFSCW